MDNHQIIQRVDLAAGGPLEKAYFEGTYGDIDAHTWRVSVYNGSAPVILTGATVSATMLRDDGTTVLIEGSVSGNVALAVISQECYAVVGTVRGSMAISKDGATVTEAICEGNVTKRTTDTVVAPGSPIQGYSEIVATEAARVAAEGDRETAEADRAAAEIARESAMVTALARLHTTKPSGIVLLGDSITSVNGLAGASYSQRGFFTWGNILLNNAFERLYNAGVSGERTDQMLARINADVIAKNPNYCHVLAGTNDVAQDVSAATIKANLAGIYEALLAENITVIAGSIPPSTAQATGGRLAVALDVNNWIKAYADLHGMIFVDYFACLAQGADGTPKATVLYDGTHPNSWGAFLMGKALYNACKNLVRPQNILPISNVDSKNLLLNSMFTGDVSGVATSWSGSGTGTPSKVATSDDIDAAWQKITVAGNNSYAISQQTPAGSFAVGESVYAVVEFAVSDITTIRSFSVSVACRDAGNATLTEGYDNFIASASELGLATGAFTGVMRTPAIVIPANTTKLLCFIRAKGIASVSFRRPAIYKV